jgi:hypothetical protein
VDLLLGDSIRKKKQKQLKNPRRACWKIKQNMDKIMRKKINKEMDKMMMMKKMNNKKKNNNNKHPPKSNKNQHKSKPSQPLEPNQPKLVPLTAKQLNHKFQINK